jgi:hypothetical protein
MFFACEGAKIAQQDEVTDQQMPGEKCRKFYWVLESSRVSSKISLFLARFGPDQWLNFDD